MKRPAAPPGGGTKERVLAELVDRMAHQLRNPLQAILVNLEVLRLRTSRSDPELWASLEDFAEGIDDGVRKLDRRLRLLVEVARAENEEPSTVVPAAVLRDLLGAAGLEDGPVRLRLVEDEGEPRGLRLRRGRFTELLFRLLLLALARARGDVTVSLREAPGAGEEEAGPQVVLELEPVAEASEPPEAWADLERAAAEAGLAVSREREGPVERLVLAPSPSGGAGR